MKKFILILLLTFGFSSNLLAQDYGTFKFKGLYLGMSLEEAQQIMSKYYSKKYMKMSPNTKEKFASLVILECVAVKGAECPIAAIFRAKYGKISEIQLQHNAINKMFNAYNLGTAEFNKKFCQSYQLPQPTMSLCQPLIERNTGKGGVLNITNHKQGWVIVFSDNDSEAKWIDLIKTTPENELKFD